MMAKKKLFPLLLALMALLAGCGGGPSAAEGAESPPNSEASVPIEDTQSPEGIQETEPESTPEIPTWSDMWLVNGNVIVARGADGACTILSSEGIPQKTLPTFSFINLLNPYCFQITVDGVNNLYDLTGSVVLTSESSFSRVVPNSSDDPWGIIMYEVAEKADFGGKNTTHFMRTDKFEEIYQADGDMSGFAGMLIYTGTQYLLKTWNADTGTYTYSTLDGTEMPDYQEVNPLAARVEYDVFLADLGYRKTELLGNGIGGLGRNKNNGTDIYNVNHKLCASYDNQVQLVSADSLGNFGLLTTYTSAAGYQTGVFDFQTGEFLLVVDGSTIDHSLEPRSIHDAYSYLSEASAFLLENRAGLHTLICKNGIIIENVSLSALSNSAAGYVLATSTTETDKVMIINVETGEIVSQFQAHLTK